MLDELIKGRKDLWLAVEKDSSDAGLDLVIRLKATRPYVLHWGLRRGRSGPWQAPPALLWPQDTQAFGSQAVQTPFPSGNGEQTLRLHFPESGNLNASHLVFDSFCPDTRQWENNQGKDFVLPLEGLKAATPSERPSEKLARDLPAGESVRHQSYPLDSGEELAVAIRRGEDGFQLTLLTDVPGPVTLHWGVPERARGQWQQPRPELQPPGTLASNATAVESPFQDVQGYRRLTLDWPAEVAPAAFSFVLHQTQAGQWLKHRGQNISVPVARPQGGSAALSDLEEQIVDKEMGDNGWTLMHRFNLCHELTTQVKDQRLGWATLFIWLRYSAIRQLDWQRNYNTKPRELSHAQDRLTARLAEAYLQESGQRDLIRMLLTCLGRGGEGQRIRDDILQIMHRHHIKEVAGQFMEEWHQKLHNNTTPDDVAICEAYLEFLRSNGNLERYWETLKSFGVTRERLLGLDRPIRHDPDFIPHLKDALIGEFQNYLKLLKSVHSATDLETAANTAGHFLDGPTRDGLGFIHQRFRDPSVPVLQLAATLTWVRQKIHDQLRGGTDLGRAKELIYLDLALEEGLRTVIERVTHSGSDVGSLLALIQHVLDNVLLLSSNAELAQCRRELERLPADGRSEADWARHTKAALDRLRRSIEGSIDESYRLMQPRAESLGRAFQADEWVVRLFSEEVVRGQPLFLLSLLLHHLDPILRRQAHLGDWQIISPSSASGKILVVESLREIQTRAFPQPTIVVAEKVYGDEEPPEGVRGVITPSSVDLVSHVAVRARNATLLFATCYDRAVFSRLQQLSGQHYEFQVTPTGDVVFAESAPEPTTPQPAKTADRTGPSTRAQPSLDVLAMDDFDQARVGGKSWHLRELKGRLPEWIGTPASMAIPFGVFDAVLADPANQRIAARYRELIQQIKPDPEPVLAQVRACLLELELPARLRDNLQQVARQCGLTWPAGHPEIPTRIKQVWASQWNSRAYFSRENRRWPHDAVQMAVLIQEVIPAEYAFVIHTVNPFNQDPNELYVEVVLGLGETLVGNYPGRALSAVCSRENSTPTLLAYPSKSVGLFGRGLIFRSDSNAEDLSGYAGAGLYDSVLLEPPQEQRLDYTQNPVVWDPAERGEFLQAMARVGWAVEKSFNSPQDVEGACVGGRYYVVQTRPQVGLQQ